MTAAKTHLSLNVSDVARSTAWYAAFFGTPPHKERPGYANFDLDQPALKLALQQSEGIAKGGTLNHLGILMPSTDDVLAAKARLEDSGMVAFTEEHVDCCYALQDKIWVSDPDGNAWEVYALLDDQLEEDHHGPSSLAVPCCEPGCCA